MGTMVFDAADLDGAGLNLQAVFNIADLPPDVSPLVSQGGAKDRAYSQVILIGHGGRRLWEAVQDRGIASDDPIDDFTVRTVADWFACRFPGISYEIVYPGDRPIGLQRLGQLAGWHHPTPFRVGIDPQWGTWYAYRAVILADSRFPPTPPRSSSSPCGNCQSRPCLSACRGGALLAEEDFDLRRCAGYRLQPESSCRLTCHARLACPAGSVHRYGADQLAHTYSRSLKWLQDMADTEA